MSALRTTILLADLDEDDEEDVDEGDDEDEGGDVGSYHVVDVLPVVEGDELKGGEHTPQQVVEAGEPAQQGSIIR